MLDSYLGEIIVFCGQFDIKGFMFCHGQEMPVNTNRQLYNVIGNLYGGTPGVTFKIPDLRGAAPLGFGTGQGLSPYPMGKSGGGDYVLTTDTIPAHTHSLYGGNVEKDSNTPSPENAYPGNTTSRTAPPKYIDAAPDPEKDIKQFDQAFMSDVGEGVPVSNKQPYMPVNYLICVEGEYPHRP